jgi:hypothetical protein
MVFIRQHLQGEFSCPFLHVNCKQAFFSESGSVTQQMHNSQYGWTCTIWSSALPPSASGA